MVTLIVAGWWMLQAAVPVSSNVSSAAVPPSASSASSASSTSSTSSAPRAIPPGSSAARILGVAEAPAVTADVGVWVPRLTGTAQVGSGGTSFDLNDDLAVEGSSAGVAGEFAVTIGRWRFGGMGFSASTSGNENAVKGGTFGDTNISVGDQIKGSYSAWMAGAEVGYVVYRPSADEPWAWSDEGDNRDAASKAFGANGRPLFDPQFLLLAGGLIFHYDQTVENVTVPSSSSFDRTVGCLYGGAGIDVQIGCDGRVPLVQDLRIYANAGVGPSIPDADIIWLLRAGIAFMINENIGVEFGYRLFDFDMQDGPSTVDAGLRGLFGGVSVRF